MPLYSSTVSATSNATANTDDTFVEIAAAAGSQLRINRVRVSIATAASDTTGQVRLVRKSAAGSGGVAGTIVKIDSNTRASSASSTVKSGTTAFSAGTITDTVEAQQVNGRAIWEFIPRDDTEEIVVAGSGIFGVIIQNSSASIVHRVTVWWED